MGGRLQTAVCPSPSMVPIHRAAMVTTVLRRRSRFAQEMGLDSQDSLKKFSRFAQERDAAGRRRSEHRPRRATMKITNVEIIPIYPRIAARNAAYKARFVNINQRVVFKVHTDAGIVGYGDARSSAPPRSSVETVIGRSPFDFLHNDL